jgi:hypothetical protein
MISGGCADVVPTWSPLTPAQQQMRDEINVFNQTVFEGALIGTALGAIGGAVWSEDRAKGAAIGAGIGGIVGSLAGSYVADKQQQYATHEAALDSMTADIRRKNEEAARLIDTMRQVLAEDKALLADLRAKSASGWMAEVRYNQALERVQQDRADMKAAVSSAETQYKTFVEAGQETKRNVVPASAAPFDREINLLRTRIATMGKIADELGTEAEAI